jgi:hypothetical protein
LKCHLYGSRETFYSWCTTDENPVVEIQEVEESNVAENFHPWIVENIDADDEHCIRLRSASTGKYVHMKKLENDNWKALATMTPDEVQATEFSYRHECHGTEDVRLVLAGKLSMRKGGQFPGGMMIVETF